MIPLLSSHIIIPLLLLFLAYSMCQALYLGAVPTVTRKVDTLPDFKKQAQRPARTALNCHHDRNGKHHALVRKVQILREAGS